MELPTSGVDSAIPPEGYRAEGQGPVQTPRLLGKCRLPCRASAWGGPAHAGWVVQGLVWGPREGVGGWTLSLLMLSPMGAAGGAGSPLGWADGIPGETIMGRARATRDSRNHISLRVTSRWSQPRGQCASVRTPQQGLDVPGGISPPGESRKWPGRQHDQGPRVG